MSIETTKPSRITGGANDRSVDRSVDRWVDRSIVRSLNRSGNAFDHFKEVQIGQK